MRREATAGRNAYRKITKRSLSIAQVWALASVVWLVLAGSAAAQRAPHIPEGTKPIPRHVLVLFGWNEKVAEKPATWPVDSMTGELFQQPLEWLGYEVSYLDIGKQPLPDRLDPKFAAVIVDAEIVIPAAREVEIADWLVAQKNRGIALLFAGGFPFSGEDAFERLRQALGIGGSGQPMPHASDITISRADTQTLAGETPLTARSTEFRDIRAPEGARVLVSLSGTDEDGNTVRYDPVFVTSWGGMWLEPYVILRASADSYLFYADPYKLLAAWLGKRTLFPAPDTTTRDGRRIFYSHIDGDGFASPAEFKGHPICGELIRDRILKAFPLPVTVSFVEADVRADVEGLDAAEAPRFAEVARDILRLPNVRTASHSYSHPYIWEPKDANPGIYDEPNLPMKAAAGYDSINVRREIVGSVDFINRELAPEGKPVELFFWPGNCRPGPEALRLVKGLGIENLNGGNTIVSRLYPGIAGVAPKCMWWDGELQIHASNQNEFMYANGFNGPFFGGFAKVIDTFERTEKPRRLKPVNVYYHFYSATYLSSLRALEKIHRWCLEQPLHPMTALDYVRMVRDSVSTQVYEIAPRHWVIANAGIQRTFRLPDYLGRPDLSQCAGVTGWTTTGGQLYVHTSGAPLTELVLVDADAETPPAIYLAESSRELHFEDLSTLTADFSGNDVRAGDVVIGGLPPSGICEVTLNGAYSRMKADASGSLSIPLPPQARVQIDATHSRYADRR